MALKSLEVILSDRDLIIKIATLARDILLKFTSIATICKEKHFYDVIIEFFK